MYSCIKEYFAIIFHLRAVNFVGGGILLCCRAIDRAETPTANAQSGCLVGAFAGMPKQNRGYKKTAFLFGRRFLGYSLISVPFWSKNR